MSYLHIPVCFWTHLVSSLCHSDLYLTQCPYLYYTLTEYLHLLKNLIQYWNHGLIFCNKLYYLTYVSPIYLYLLTPASLCRYLLRFRPPVGPLLGTVPHVLFQEFCWLWYRSKAFSVFMSGSSADQDPALKKWFWNFLFTSSLYLVIFNHKTHNRDK